MRATDKEALICARLCELSYVDFNGFLFNESLERELGLPNIHTFDTAGVQAFVAWNDSTMFVCFRGTDSFDDWLADAMGTLTPFHSGGQKVHTGFMRTLLVIESDVGKCVLDNVGTRLLYITGHSLGAAMAVLFSMRWVQSTIDGVVTFGCPRPGNQAFSENFNLIHREHSLRFVNNNDAVPRVPWKCKGYSHVWRLQYFDRTGKLHEDFWPTKIWKLWDSVAGRIRHLARLKLGDGITDHSITDYRKLVEKAREATDDSIARESN